MEHQAEVAAAHENPQLAENLRRAAELTRLPDDEVLAIYEALRPGRSTPGQLTALAGELAGDDEMLGVLLRSLPGTVAVGRGNVGGTLGGTPAGHRYAAALGLALAGNG